MFLMMNTSFAENLDQNINHDSSNIMRYSAEPGSKTILSTLSESDKLKAEADFKKGKKDYYNLGRKEPGGLKQLYAAPTMAYISTPYSLYRHGIYLEKQTFIPFSNELKAELEAHADKVYIYTYSNPMWGMPSYIGNIVIKKDGKIYNGYFYNRSHLIADSLGGRSYKYNVVTGTRQQNVGNNGNGGMQYIEKKVKDYVEQTKNNVYYSVEPYYEGNELVPRYVIVNAKSDDGVINEKVKVFNNASGYEINYSDGRFLAFILCKCRHNCQS